MDKKRLTARRPLAVFMSVLMAASAVSSLPAITASAASYSEMSALDQYAYSGDDLGAVYTPDSTTFKVWAPTATSVKLKRYQTGSDSESGAMVLGTVAMTKGSQGIWSVTVNGDLAGTYYTYLVTNNGVEKETVDIYAKSTGVNGKRGMVIDLDSTDPAGWANDHRVSCPNQTDAVIWEAHVRDFSISPDSGMTNKGKYLAFTETGTTVNNDGQHPTGVDYLADLGVTHVHLLPVYDYGSVDETKLNTDQFNWGYDPMNYNTPEGSYSTNPYDGNVRVREFKQMVQSLHNKGIGVVMDVVYNHTYAGDSGINDWFDYTVPGYYYRQDSTGKLSNASGCGNETASDRAMYQKFMIDSLKYWATEYHLDGFRFDLMGIHDTDTMNKIRQELDKIDPDILIYGEPWTAAATPCPKATAVQGNMKLVSEEVAAFNDKVRDAIKGSCFNKTDKGFIQGAGYEYALKGGIQASSTTMSGDSKWSKQPSQTVTYTSAHDNYTLYDKLVTSCKGGSGYGTRYEDLVAMNKLAGGIILTSQGMSFFQAGEEFARTKYGDENSYKSASSVNQLVWNNTITYADIVAYYKGLIEIRKAYAPFRDPTNTSNDTIYFSWGDSMPSNVVAFTMYNKLSTDGWNFAAVIHNANSTEKTVTLMNDSTKVTLPSQWVIVANGTKAGLESLGTAGSTVKVPARSTMVLIDKTSFDNTTFTTKGTVTVNHIITSSGQTYKTETLRGEVGTAYSTAPLSELTAQGYTVQRISGSTTGSFSEAGAEVSYYYDIDPSKIGTVYVNYYADPPYQLLPMETYTGVIGTAYNFTPKKIDGYECDISSTANASGTYSKQDITINFVYYRVENTGVKVHYYNSNGWSQVAMYLYTGSGSSAVLYSGEWPGTLMTDDGNGWFSGSCSEIESGSFIATNNVKNNGQQDPSGYNTPGYEVKGEVWIKNGVKYPTGKVVVLYNDTEGNQIGRETLSGMADGTNRYATQPKTFENYELVTSPDNAAGLYTEQLQTVTYVYRSTAAPQNPVVNKSYLKSQNVNVGDKIEVVGSASDGQAPYSYTFEYKAPSSSSWTSFGSGSSASFTATENGTYKIKSVVVDSAQISSVKYLEAVVSETPSQLQNNSTVNSTQVNVGTDVVITGAASGGTAPYTFTYQFKRSTASDWTTLGSGATAKFRPSAPGTFNIRAYVKDSTGKAVCKSLTVKAVSSSGELTNNSTTEANVALGNAVVVKGAATGGTAPYTFTYQYKRSTASDWTTFGSGTQASFKPSAAGTFNIRAYVKDSTGKAVCKSLTVKITASSGELTNNSTTEANVALGNAVVVKGAASGGTAPYTFTYQYKRSTASDWTTFGSGTQASFKPSAAGTFNIRAYVKDSTGKTVCKSLSVKINADQNSLVNKSYLSNTDDLIVGDRVTVTSVATGGSGVYSYKVEYKRQSASAWNTLSTSATSYFKPSSAGVFMIRVTAADTEGRSAAKEYTIVFNTL